MITPQTAPTSNSIQAAEISELRLSIPGFMALMQTLCSSQETIIRCSILEDLWNYLLWHIFRTDSLGEEAKAISIVEMDQDGYCGEKVKQASARECLEVCTLSKSTSPVSWSWSLACWPTVSQCTKAKNEFRQGYNQLHLAMPKMLSLNLLKCVF